MADLLTYAQALRKIEETVSPLPPVRVNWRDALGLTLAESVHARESYPAFDNSAVDGYAVRFADVSLASPDLPAALQIQRDIYAGEPLPPPLMPGRTAPIMTGAPLPEGADAVVMVEHTQRLEDRVLVFRPASPGEHIRRKSDEVSVGVTLIPAGARVGGVEQGLLAMQGILDVSVRLLPSVAVLATGDELVEPEEPVTGGQIRNINTYTLTAELRQIGCPVLNLGIGRDDRAPLREKLEKGLAEAQVLITAGGVSAGEKDYLPDLLRELGVEALFHKAAVRPGKPILFGRRDDRIVFGLPGNVVSVLASFHLFVKPALRRLVGREDWRNPTGYARIGQAMRNPGGRTHFVRCRLSPSPAGGPIAFPTGKQGSGMLTSLRGADGFAVIPSDLEQVEEFDVLEFIPIQVGL